MDDSNAKESNEKEEDTNLDETVRQISHLCLDQLSSRWVHQMWDEQFTEAAPPPGGFMREVIQGHEDEVAATLEKITNVARKWIEEHRAPTADAESGDDSHNASSVTPVGGYWSSLNERGVNYKGLIALLFYLIDGARELNASPTQRKLCTMATGLYVVLLAMPDSRAFRIFHPVLFNKALETFKLALKLHFVRFSPKKKQRSNKASKKAQASSSQPLPAKERPRRRHCSRASSGSVDTVEEESNGDSDEEEGLSFQEVQVLANSLNKVLFHFIFFLDHSSSLRASLESLEKSMQELVLLTHLETGIASLDFGLYRHQRRSELSSLAFNAYTALEKICTCPQLHGDSARNCLLACKYLLPGLLMTPRGASEIAPKGLAVIREHTLHFLKHLVSVVGEPSHGAVEVLIQHVALQVPDRAEFRQKASLSILGLMRKLPDDVFRRVIFWFCRWAHSEKLAHRQFSIEMLGRLLMEEGPSDERENESDIEVDTEDVDEDGAPVPRKKQALIAHKFIFGVIFSRCRDLAATVRAKALHIVADITAANNGPMVEIFQNLFADQERADNVRGQDIRKKDWTGVDFVEILEKPDADLTSVDPLPPSDVFLEFLRHRALDESVFVRKSALQVLENILKFGRVHPSEELVSVLRDHCRDSSLMVRKQMVCSLTDLVKKFPEDNIVIRLWVDGVFPLFLDVEQRVAEKVHECVWECLFKNLVRFSESKQSSHFLPWKIMCQAKSLKMTKYLSRACGNWAKEELLKSSLLEVLKTHVDTENKDYAWLLLSLVTVHVPVQDPHFVMEYFNTSIHMPEGVGLYTLLHVLRVLFASVIRLSVDEQKQLQQDLVLLVTRFAVPPELISTAIDIATVVSDIEATEPGEGGQVNRNTEAFHKRYQTLVDDWAVEIIKVIDKELTAKILNPTCSQDGGDAESVRMMRQIFTLGELAQICPTKINNRLFLLMQSIIFQEGKKHHPKNKHNNDSAPEIPSSQTQRSQPPPCAFTPTTRLQAVAIVTLAKMCLQHEDMAKKIVPAFGRLLDTAGAEVSIKNNVMYALTDMCVRYANLVDPLISQMTACLKDPSLVVRSTTLVTLIYLLQEDYLKMSGRGTFFFRILQTLCDESEEIRHLTTFYMQQRLLKRNPKVMYSHFIEAIFHFNEYEDHPKFNKFILSEHEKKLFSLKGPNHKSERIKLYKFMLEHMTDEYRFQTTYRLCQDILNGAVEGLVQLNEDSYGLLQDTLWCLASEEIKLASLRSKQEDVGENEDGTENTQSSSNQDVRGALIVAARKSIISQFVKKNVIENIIPIIIALKHRLEELKSPLIGDLMNCLRELMKDYKNEVKDMLAADKQLAAEIEFDLKKWAAQEEEAARKEAEAVQSSPTQHERLIRIFLESAVSAIKDKMQRRSDGRRSNEEREESASEAGDNEPVLDEEVTPLENFLESNHALEGDRLPDQIPQMLSPNVRVEDISASLVGRTSREQENTARKRLVMEDENENTDAQLEAETRGEQNKAKETHAAVEESCEDMLEPAASTSASTAGKKARNQGNKDKEPTEKNTSVEDLPAPLQGGDLSLADKMTGKGENKTKKRPARVEESDDDSLAAKKSRRGEVKTKKPQAPIKGSTDDRLSPEDIDAPVTAKSTEKGQNREEEAPTDEDVPAPRADVDLPVTDKKARKGKSKTKRLEAVEEPSEEPLAAKKSRRGEVKTKETPTPNKDSTDDRLSPEEDIDAPMAAKSIEKDQNREEEAPTDHDVPAPGADVDLPMTDKKARKGKHKTKRLEAVEEPSEEPLAAKKSRRGEVETKKTQAPKKGSTDDRLSPEEDIDAPVAAKSMEKDQNREEEAPADEDVPAPRADVDLPMTDKKMRKGKHKTKRLEAVEEPSEEPLAAKKSRRGEVKTKKTPTLKKDSTDDRLSPEEDIDAPVAAKSMEKGQNGEEETLTDEDVPAPRADVDLPVTDKKARKGKSKTKRLEAVGEPSEEPLAAKKSRRGEVKTKVTPTPKEKSDMGLAARIDGIDASDSGNGENMPKKRRVSVKGTHRGRSSADGGASSSMVDNRAREKGDEARKRPMPAEKVNEEVPAALVPATPLVPVVEINALDDDTVSFHLGLGDGCSQKKSKDGKKEKGPHHSRSASKEPVEKEANVSVAADIVSERDDGDASMRSRKSGKDGPEANDLSDLRASPKTPQPTVVLKRMTTKALYGLRAISTPQKDESLLRANVTFLEKSQDLSSIPELSPPSPKRPRSREDDGNSTRSSFRFHRGKRDPFEDLMRDTERKEKSSQHKSKRGGRRR